MRGLSTQAPAENTPVSKRSSEPSFALFQTFEEEPLQEMLAEAKRFADAVITSPWEGAYCLSLLGRSGNGKTMLARCILSALKVNAHGTSDVIAERIDRGRFIRFECQFRDWRKVSEKLKNGEWGVVDAMEEPQLLVLDDIGADYDPNSIAAGKLDRLLRARSGKWTVLTSNLSLAEINTRMDGRIASFLIRDRNRWTEVSTKDFWVR